MDTKHGRPSDAPFGPLDPADLENQWATEDAPAEPLSLAPGEWKIADLAELDRVLARMARKERFMAENRALVEREIARLRQWEADENAALERSRASDEAHVRVYVEANRETLGRYRNLPHGRVEWKRRKEGTYRWRQDMTAKEREAALLAWAKKEADATGECLTSDNPRPDLDAIKRHLGALDAEERTDALGNVLAPPGLEWVPPGETLTISVEEKKR